jgi:hypothetical protein
MMKNLFLALSCMFLVLPKNASAQDLDSYKYVIVPSEYGFLGEPDKYKLNSMTVFLFEKYGFDAIMEGEPFPEDLKNNPCSALNADVHSDPGMFKLVTKVKVVLKDCNRQIVFESKEGRSRLKKYNFSYKQALRDAFSSIDALDYEYKEPVPAAEKIPEPKEKPILEENANLVYTYENQKYLLSKTDEAWVLKYAEAKTPAAFLYKTNRSSFVFRSKKTNGTAYFDEEGNLVVEYFDENSGSMEKLVYEKTNSRTP